MADEYEQYHVPQQSRRDKLRVVNPQQGCVDYLQSCAPTLYDPSSLHNISIVPSDLLTCSSSAANVHHQHKSFNLYAQSSIFAPSMSSYVDPTSNPRALLNDNGGQGPYGYTSAHDNYRGSFDNVVVNASQSLSLSLSSHNNNNNNNNNAQNSSNHNHVVPLELNLQRYDYDFGGGSGNSNFLTGNSVSGSGSGSVELCRSAVPLGPFTGYASVLKKSRFLKPAQQLLEELCDNGSGGVCVEKMDSSLLDAPLLEGLGDGNEVIGDHEALSFSGDGSSEQIRKKSRLLSMLDEVYKRYKLYYQQMQAVVSSFESVAGLSNAAPFASLALKSLSKHFKCLKNTITEQLQFTIKYHHGKASYERDESQRLDNPGMGSYGQRPFQSPRFVDQPVWRPQRGLPERAVSVLRAWLFEHFLHPYPTDTDKMMLAKQTGLSRNQVSNWFINARVRLWKPMVEEIHMLETRQGQKQPQREEPPSANRPNDHNMPTSSSVDCENASTSFQGIGDFPLKRSREETETPAGPMNLHYENVQHHHPHLGGGMSNAGGSGGVSLTLGLHQNNVALSEPYPMNAARRFGLDAHGEAYMLSGFATQNRQYG